MSILCGHCHASHESVGEVFACSRGYNTNVESPIPRPKSQPLLATLGQLAYIERLITTHVVEPKLQYLNHPDERARVTRPQASAVIDRLKAAPMLAAREPVAEGIYRRDNTYYKVIRAVHGSGRLYAKVLLSADEYEFVWVKAPGMQFKLDPSEKISMSEAAEFGRLYGRCMVCGAVLTNETSIAAGIGPICAERWAS